MRQETHTLVNRKKESGPEARAIGALFREANGELLLANSKDEGHRSEIQIIPIPRTSSQY